MTPRILVVEDDASIRRAIVDSITDHGWEVEQAMDGELGLQLALENHYHCLVLDLMLPRVNGYELCQTLRREGKDVPIIMISALNEEPDVLKGFRVGTTDYLRKPFSLAELMMRLKVHIGTVSNTLSFQNYQLDLTSNLLTLPSQDQATLDQVTLDLSLIHI